MDQFIVGRTGFCLNRFDYGISEQIGARRTMEDRSIVCQSLKYDSSGAWGGECDDALREVSMTSFAAVFDGHGGDECSDYLVDAIPNKVSGRSERALRKTKCKSQITNLYIAQLHSFCSLASSLLH